MNSILKFEPPPKPPKPARKKHSGNTGILVAMLLFAAIVILHEYFPQALPVPEFLGGTPSAAP